MQLTLPQLLQIKREKMGLTKTEATKQSGVTMLPVYERGKAIPSKRMLGKLVSYYKITNDELSNIKDAPAIPKATKEQQVQYTLNQVLELLTKVDNMPKMGFLGDNMKNKCAEKLEEIKANLEDVLILDKLL